MHSLLIVISFRVLEQIRICIYNIMCWVETVAPFNMNFLASLFLSENYFQIHNNNNQKKNENLPGCSKQLFIGNFFELLITLIVKSFSRPKYPMGRKKTFEKFLANKWISLEKLYLMYAQTFNAIHIIDGFIYAAIFRSWLFSECFVHC